MLHFYYIRICYAAFDCNHHKLSILGQFISRPKISVVLTHFVVL